MTFFFVVFFFFQLVFISAGAKLVLPSGEIPTLKPVDKNLSRPRLPPPGPPGNNGERGMSNGQSNESLCSMDDGPIAPPRKVSVCFTLFFKFLFLTFFYNFDSVKIKELKMFWYLFCVVFFVGVYL